MRKTRHALGQTLIEVLTTILFIVVSVIALVRFQNYLSYNNSLTQQKTAATLLATSKIETLRDYQVLEDTTGYTSYESIASGSSTSSDQSTTYTMTWAVTSFTHPTYKIINVVVSWTDRRGTSQSIQLSTRIGGVDPSYSSEVMS